MLRVGIFQLESHPAVRLSERNLLAEPFVPKANHTCFTKLQRFCTRLDGTADEIQRIYTEWQKRRIHRVLEWLSLERDLPHILVFPECSLPFEVLPSVNEYAQKLNLVVFAGTHSPYLGETHLTTYKKVLNAPGPNIKKTLRQSVPPSAVLPIISDDKTVLVGKNAPSIFERCDVDRPRGTAFQQDVVPIRVGQKTFNSLPLICSDALKWAEHEGKPDLAVFVCYDKAPERFDAYVQRFIDNQVPVVLANDAKFGGSRVAVAVDARPAGWWFDSPDYGALPAGDAYLQIAINTDVRSIQVGTSNPEATYVLERICPIYYSNAGEALAQRVKTALDSQDATQIAHCAHTLGEPHSHVLLRRQLRHLETILRNKGAYESWRDVIGNCVIVHEQSLNDLEQSLTALASRALAEVFDSGAVADWSEQQVGEAYKYRTLLTTIAGTHGDSTPPNTRQPVAIIGRDTEITTVRDFCAAGNESVMILTGLEAVGKTEVIKTALNQASVGCLHIPCRPGVSGDYLYEFICRATHRSPHRNAPREKFAATDIADAINDYDVLWIDGCQQMLEYGKWRNLSLERFMHALLGALTIVRTKVVFESRRGFDLGEPIGMSPVRRRITGFAARAKDGAAYFRQQLRRADVPSDTVANADIDMIVELTDGHPGMLQLCASACADDGVARVIKDLRARRGFYLGAVHKIVSRIHISRDAIRCLHVLATCETAVPVSLLAGAVSADDAYPAVRELLQSCLVERDRDDRISLTSLLVDVPFVDEEIISDDELIQFHRDAAQYYKEKWDAEEGVIMYTAGLAANYHAALAGIREPCDMLGMLDGAARAAKIAYDREEFDKVISILGPYENRRVTEDVLMILGEAYAWSNRFADAFRVGDKVCQNRRYIEYYTNICTAAIRARQFDHATTALKRAENLEPGYYRIDQLAGRLAERTGNLIEAEERFRKAVSKTENDGWPYFYLIRLLIRRGLPEEALSVVDEAREMLKEVSGHRNTRNIENAILSQEAVALLMTGGKESVRTTVELLEARPDTSPEIIVCIAYVKAALEGVDGSKRITLYEQALKKLRRKESRKAHVRAKSHFFKGKLYEQMGMLADAETEYATASSLDSYNVHMKVCLFRVLLSIARSARNAGDEVAMGSAASRALEVVKKVLEYDNGNSEARSAQEDIYNEFRLE